MWFLFVIKTTANGLYCLTSFSSALYLRKLKLFKMQNPSAVTQESGPALDLVTQFGHLAFNQSFYSLNSDGFYSFKPNYMYFSGFSDSVSLKKRRVVAAASLSLGARKSVSSSVRRIVNEFNRAVKFHCDRIPIGFASVRVGSEDGNGVRGEDGSVLEVEGLPLNRVETETPKKVLILARPEAVFKIVHDLHQLVR